jgi:large conductance mechanosensitive channel
LTNVKPLKQKIMGMIKEFKTFAMRGNVIDMAVGIVIGAAFGKIVSSLVTDIVMPPIGLLLGGVDFSEILIPLKDASVNAAGEEVGPVTVNVGVFLNTVIEFIIIAFAIFMVIKAMNSLKRKKEAAAPPPPPVPTAEEKLLIEIRDLLKK